MAVTLLLRLALKHWQRRRERRPVHVDAAGSQPPCTWSGALGTVQPTIVHWCSQPPGAPGATLGTVQSVDCAQPSQPSSIVQSSTVQPLLGATGRGV